MSETSAQPTLTFETVPRWLRPGMNDAELVEAEEGEETEAARVHPALSSLLDSPRTAPIG